MCKNLKLYNFPKRENRTQHKILLLPKTKVALIENFPLKK